MRRADPRDGPRVPASAEAARVAMARVAVPLGAVILAGCATTPSGRGASLPADSPAPAASSPEPGGAGPLTAEPPLVVEDGPEVSDPVALLAWLAASGPLRVQLPVTVTFTPERTAVAAATVGAAPDGLALRLDDAALGVSLLDGARRLCPKGSTCALWLEGRWVAAPGDAPPHRFAVLRVLGPADATAPRARRERR